jgi:hypothetical protein
VSQEVGLSRSALADRFIGLIDMPPMRYLASWLAPMEEGLNAQPTPRGLRR